MDSRVAAVLSLVERQPNIDIQALASLVNLSSSRLRHLFRAQMHVSLHYHRKHQRLINAQSLLHTSFLSIKQIANASGFTNAHHFAREFRKAFATSPRRYRQAAFDAKENERPMSARSPTFITR